MSTIQSPMHAEFLQDIFIAAMEGTVGEWAEIRNYTYGPDTMQVADENGLYQAHAEIRGSFEEENGPWHVLSLDTIQYGIDRIVTEDIEHLDDELRQRIEDGAADLDSTIIDFEAADAIVQVAVFGDVFYS